MNITKALGCAIILLCATFGVDSARAADLEDTAPSWTGPYIGVNVGYGWDTGSADINPGFVDDPIVQGLPEIFQAVVGAGSFPESLSSDAHGISGGGQIGFNFQPASDWVVGIEADIQGADIGGSRSERKTPQLFDQTKTGISKEVDWFGTVRARAGYLINPQWLIYATGGLAYGETGLGFKERNLTQGCGEALVCSDGESSGVKVGWTAGGGTEMLLSSNWSLKAEYLYIDLGKRSVDTKNDPSPIFSGTTADILFDTSARFREHVLRVGLNYHFD